MLKTVLAGFAAATVISGTALAAGPLSVTTDFPTSVVPSDPFKADLASIGVGVELASPTFVSVFAPTKLTFRLLESHDATAGPQITALTVGDQTFNFGPQAFTSPGALLGQVLFSGDFTGQVGFRDATLPDDAPPYLWPDSFQVYIRTADEPEFTGIGPFIGAVDTLYFSIAGAALFEVTSLGVPEPGTWALMIAGFGLAGVALRRRRIAIA